MKLSRNDKVILAQKHSCTVEYIRLIENGERPCETIMADIKYLLEEREKIIKRVMSMSAAPSARKEKKVAKRKPIVNNKSYDNS